jgi:hypothetical protein
LPGRDDAYSIATSRSKVVERNAFSIPPRTPCALASRKLFGSAPPERPRYTLVARVSFEDFTMDELITCAVVTY